MSPPFPQCLEAGQGGTSIVPIVDNRPGVRAEDRGIIVYSVDPKIKKDIHFRAFAFPDQSVDFINRKEEKTSILFAWIIVFQDSIIILPIGDLELDQSIFLQQGIGDAAFLLKMLQDGNGLMLEPTTKPILQFCDATDPFPW